MALTIRGWRKIRSRIARPLKRQSYATLHYHSLSEEEMKTAITELMQDFSEVVKYEQAGVPLYIRTSLLSFYPDMSAPCHWHDDIEWIHILEGRMSYYVNGKRLLLKENDSLMVNARQMHYGYSFQKQDCRFSCILFHPSLFCSNQILQKKYVTPILENCGLEYLCLPSGTEGGEEAAQSLSQIVSLKEKEEEGYEMEAIAQMQMLWGRLLQKKLLFPSQDNQQIPDDLKTQKDIVSFLYQHYSEKLSLDEIAAAGHVSRSKCCRIFKHYLQQTPMDFLNAYRLKVSCNLLDATDKSITEIAFACGFNHLSYFSKTFYNSYGCTPREYRERFRSSHP